MALSWRSKVAVAWGTTKANGWLVADIPEETFELKVKRKVIVLSDRMKPNFTDYAFTFVSMPQGGTPTKFTINFPTTTVKGSDGKQRRKTWGRIAGYFYKQVQTCRKWIPVLREGFATYPRLKDVFVELRGLLEMEHFWDERVHRRRKEIYCWEEIMCVESKERGLPSKMLRASYDYCKEDRKNIDSDDEDEDKAAQPYDYDGLGGGEEQQQKDLGQFGRPPKFKISITHERMDQILQLYPKERELLRNLKAKRKKENLQKPKNDQKTDKETEELAELEFWARYFIRVHNGRRKFPDERFRHMLSDADSCYFERDACLMKVLLAASVEHDVVQQNETEDMDNEESDKERR